MPIPVCLFGLILALLWPCVASAHPHVFIDNRVTVVFADKAVTGFRAEWRFDEIFTADLLAQFDADADGQFSAAESEQVRTETLPNLKTFHYFTYLTVNGSDLGTQEPADFKADIVGGAVRFLFTYALAQPVDPAKDKIGLSIYDREYYVEVLMAANDPVVIEGSDGCRALIADDPANAYYGGFVVPQAISVACP